MKMRNPTLEEYAQAQSETYSLVGVSENGKWNVAVKPVIFGKRVIIYETGSPGPCMEYCAGNDESFLLNLLVTVLAVMTGIPEEVSEQEILRVLPDWKVRPINKDPSWERLKELAARKEYVD